MLASGAREDEVASPSGTVETIGAAEEGVASDGAGCLDSVAAEVAGGAGFSDEGAADVGIASDGAGCLDSVAAEVAGGAGFSDEGAADDSPVTGQ